MVEALGASCSAHQELRSSRRIDANRVSRRELGEQKSARSVCALAVLTLIWPCPQTVITRLSRIVGIGIDERGPEVVADAAHQPQLLQAVERGVLARIGLLQQLVERVLGRALLRRRARIRVALTSSLVGIGPVDDRAADRLAIGELTVASRCSNSGSYCGPPISPQQLRRQTASA